MGKKISGIAALSSVILMLVVLLLTFLRGEFFAAVNVQLLIVLFTLSIITVGIYLLNTTTRPVNKRVKLAISAYGIGCVIFSIFVAFDLISFLDSFNWLICLGILFVLFVQLQVLRWGRRQSIATKVCSFAVILADLFLMLYFIAEWNYSGLALWIDIATTLSIVAFVVGMATLKKVQPETE
jgi:hypothetical protein